MRSLGHKLVGWIAIGALASCTDPIGEPPGAPASCEHSDLDYVSTAAPFVVNWCRGCHAGALPQDMRQGAPLDVNFDNESEVRAAADRIRVRATGDRPSMPPVGGPSVEERALVREWLDCGMP